MENIMNLHNDRESFFAAIQVTSDRLKIVPVFIEKDYWITLVLKRLSEITYFDNVVFKGGTSLSKGYKIIDRFSEDIDIAVLNVSELSGNQVKNLIRDVEKTITTDLSEILDHPETSKGSLFSKSYYSYTKTGDERFYLGVSDKLIIEINSFTNPYPFEKREIMSLIGFSLVQNNQNDLMRKYGLMPFEINILNKNQTLIEKLASLLRFSFADNSVESISGKIRHFYDLYFLLMNNGCKRFIDSDEFSEKMKTVWSHDQITFNDPPGWQGKAFFESPLCKEFPDLWNKIKDSYRKELSALAFNTIPNENKIADAFIYILSKLPRS